MNSSFSPSVASRSATMQDIAGRLNLSVATVSRAIRRLPGINAETRARVFKAASEIGYQLPGGEGVGDAENGSLQHIGVFLETEDSHLPSPYLTGMSEACTTLNASLVVHSVKPGECEAVLDPARAPRAMRSGLLSGIVLVHWWPLPVVKALSAKLPTVSIVHRYSGVDMDLVGIDNEGGMSLLMQELYARGHRKFAFIGRCGRLHWANARFGGYVAALSALGLDYDGRSIVDVDFETLTNFHASWERHADRVEAMVRRDGVTALVCASEPAGWGVHHHLTARGLRIPQDVSLTGFHRPSGERQPHPDLTSVGASYEAIGAAALRRLLSRIRNMADSPRTILFPCELYRGGTIGTAPILK